MKFPPVNLWSKPMQKEYDNELDFIAILTDLLSDLKRREQSLTINTDVVRRQKEAAERRLKALNFIYYTRTGRFFDDK
jgi:hypothetical protein